MHEHVRVHVVPGSYMYMYVHADQPMVSPKDSHFTKCKKLHFSGGTQDDRLQL